MKLRGRIVVHGNRDDERDKVRSDYVFAEMEVIRMLLTMGTCLGF